MKIYSVNLREFNALSRYYKGLFFWRKIKKGVFLINCFTNVVKRAKKIINKNGYI